VLAHVGGIPVEEALLAAPALLAGVTAIAGYVRAPAARPRRSTASRLMRLLGRRLVHARARKRWKRRMRCSVPVQ
jgi:hypothetical protein